MTGEFEVLHSDKLDRYTRLEAFYNEVKSAVEEHEAVWGVGAGYILLNKIKNIIGKVDKPNLPGSHDF